MKKAIVIRNKETGKIEQSGMVDMTPKQVIKRQAEEAKWFTDKPLRDWEREIQELDNGMPRSTEDMISVLTRQQQDKLPKETRDKFDAKQKLRQRRPNRVS